MYVNCEPKHNLTFSNEILVSPRSFSFTFWWKNDFPLGFGFGPPTGGHIRIMELVLSFRKSLSRSTISSTIFFRDWFFRRCRRRQATSCRTWKYDAIFIVCFTNQVFLVQRRNKSRIFCASICRTNVKSQWRILQIFSSSPGTQFLGNLKSFASKHRLPMIHIFFFCTNVCLLGYQIKNTDWKILKYWWFPFFLPGKNFQPRGQMAGCKKKRRNPASRWKLLKVAHGAKWAFCPPSPLLLLQQFAFFPVEGLF